MLFERKIELWELPTILERFWEMRRQTALSGSPTTRHKLQLKDDDLLKRYSYQAGGSYGDLES